MPATAFAAGAGRAECTPVMIARGHSAMWRVIGEATAARKGTRCTESITIEASGRATNMMRLLASTATHR
eukprot:3619812-Prymnesium_polylepis.1